MHDGSGRPSTDYPPTTSAGIGYTLATPTGDEASLPADEPPRKNRIDAGISGRRRTSVGYRVVCTRAHSDPSGSIRSSSPPIATATLGIDRVDTSHGMRSSKKGPHTA
ncbi:hypothetical protein ColKHC_03970 [Colletotrichum higginsianum]|nr:hypothetical protein ColKHC_03970 [Colletotrichum higginsianum]